MSVTITSVQCSAVKWTSDNAKSILDGVILDRYKAVINFYISKLSAGKNLKFNSGTNTIVNNNALDNEDFTKTWNVGEHIKIPESASNSGDLTLIGVSQRTLYVSNSLTNETLQVGNIHLNSQVTNLEFFYNLIQQALLANYQTGNVSNYKYIVSGLNAADTSTTSYLQIGTKDFSWVFDAVTAPTQSTSTIVGAGWAHSSSSDDFKQYFTLTHYFNQFLPSFAGPNLLSQISNNNGPLNSLCYAANINAKYDASGNIYNTGNYIGNGGLGAWFNENNSGTIPEYTLNSIVYTDSLGNPLTALDFSKQCNVTIKIKSASGLFSNNETYISLRHIYIPLNDSQYINTPTTQPQNLMGDNARQKAGASAINGVNYGTSYQVLENVVVTYVDTYNLTITFSTVYASQLQDTLKGQSSANRNYILSITTENIVGFGANITDRVCIICDQQNMQYDQSNPNLMGLIDYIHAFHYPNINGGEKNSFAGYEGDPVFAQIPFWTETAASGGVVPTFKTASARIVAKKSGQPDFIIEKQDIDVSLICLLNNTAQPNVNNTKGYNSYSGDPYNSIILQRQSSNDSGTKKAYLLQYGFVLRYDYWAQILTANPGGVVCNNPINNDIANVNNSWSNLIQNGWTLAFRFYGEMIGYDGFVTTYQADTNIECRALGLANDSGPNFACQINYYDTNGDPVNGIQTGTQTKVSAVFTPDVPAFPSGFNAYFGAIFIDLLNQGGPTTRRFCSTEIPSESSSPFSAPPARSDASSSYSNCNATMNIYNSTGILIVETIFDDTVWPLEQFIQTAMLAARIGYKDSSLQTNSGIDIETNNSQILQPN